MRKNSDEYVYHLILHYQIVLALLHRIFNLAGIDWVPLCFFFFCLFVFFNEILFIFLWYHCVDGTDDDIFFKGFGNHEMQASV